MATPKAYFGEKTVRTYDSRHFGGKSGRYIFQKEIDIIDRLLNSGSGLILDAPCGTGIYADHYHRRGFRLIGVDASEQMLRESRSRQECLNLVLCDINHLPFKENSIDMIMMIRLCQHLPQKQIMLILREFERVSKPKGRVIFDTLRWSPRAVRPEALDGMHVYALSRIEEMIREAGLAKVNAVSAYLFSAIWYRKLPLILIKVLEMIERAVPPAWLLRTFWACESANK